MHNKEREDQIIKLNMRIAYVEKRDRHCVLITLYIYGPSLPTRI